MLSDVTELKVYRESLELLPELYLVLKKLPRAEMDLEFQAKRSAKAVSANIAEGFAKRSSSKEFKRYLLIALGSNDETISHLRTISIVIPELSDPVSILLNKYKILSKQINALHKKWFPN